MRRALLALSYCLPLAASAIVIAQETINPQHSIKCAESGWDRLSQDGRWFAHNYVENGGARPIRLFDLREHSAREFSPKERLFSGSSSYDFSRWFIDYAGVWYKNAQIRIWDLNSSSGLPAIVLPSGYSSPRVNAAGTHLAAIHRISGGVSTLRIWDLQKPVLQADHFRELGAVSGSISPDSRFLFTANGGIIAVTDGGLARWDLGGPDKAPVILALDNGVERIWQTVEYWSRGISKTGEASSLYWQRPNGKTLLTDLPRAPTNPRTWEVTGQIRTFDGKYLVERRESECWLTQFDGMSTSSTKLFGSAGGTYDTVLRLGKSNYLLISNCEWFAPVEMLTGIKTYVFSLIDPRAPPVVLDVRQRTAAEHVDLNDFRCFYITSPAAKWLIGRSKAKMTVWDLSKPLSAEGTGGLTGIKGTAQGHCLAGDRWLIIIGGDGRLYFVDMDAQTTPRATEFFRLEPSKRLVYTAGAAKDRIFVSDFTAKMVHIWNVSQFERVSSRP